MIEPVKMGTVIVALGVKIDAEQLRKMPAENARAILEGIGRIIVAAQGKAQPPGA